MEFELSKKDVQAIDNYFSMVIENLLNATDDRDEIEEMNRILNKLWEERKENLKGIYQETYNSIREEMGL